MEKTIEVKGRAMLARLAAKAAPLALLALLFWINQGPLPAAGAVAGVVAAVLYASGYLGSHIAAAFQRTGPADVRVLGSAFVRLAAAAAGAGLSYLAGRQVLIAYLVSFGAAFAILVVSEAPRIRRSLAAAGAGGAGEAAR